MVVDKVGGDVPADPSVCKGLVAKNEKKTIESEMSCIRYPIISLQLMPGLMKPIAKLNKSFL